MKATLFVAAALLAVGSAAHVQEIPPTQNPPPAAPPVAAPAAWPAAAPAPAPAPAQAPVPAQAPSARRRDLGRMEGILMQALKEGAQELARQLKLREPNSAFVTGTGRARGFILDGYGMFFDVDVPGMRQSVVWSAQMLELERERQNTIQFLENSGPNHPLRKVAELNLRQIERHMGATHGAVVVPTETLNAQMALGPGRVGATAVADGVAVSPPVQSGTSEAASQPLQQVQSLRDPNELYTDSVKNALIDAMLDFSAFLKIADNEWLTVAASDSDGPSPGQIDDASRILIRIKGADLTAFQANKLTRAEVLKKVEVKEF